MLFLSQLINGIQIGSIYALVALGYSMVYGIVKLINFAHGDIIMMGSYAVWFFIARLNLPPAVSIILSILFCALLGVTIEKVAYKPLRNSSPHFAAYHRHRYFLPAPVRDAAHFHAEPQNVYEPLPGRLPLGSFNISNATLVTSCVSIVMMVLLTLLSTIPKWARPCAVSEDNEAAQPWASTSTTRSPLRLPSARPSRRSRRCSTAAPTSRS